MKERKTFAAIRTSGVVLATADESRFQVESSGVDAFRRVSVAFAPTTHSEVRNRVKVGL